MTDFSLHRRAQECIAQGYLTNSKRPESLVKGVYPTHLKRGQGCHVFDHEGKKYLDFICGLGTNILGYGHGRVNQAMIDQMIHGASLSLATHLELEAAEKLKEMFPFVDAVKFLKTGTEACAAAIRIARTKTGRYTVLSDGYHGWSDGFVSLSPPAVGIPKQEAIAKLGNVENTLGDGKLLAQTAAIIIEPVITDYSPERLTYLQNLRDLCTKYGVMLIFDEVITGFRFPKYSVTGWTGITPDLIVLGKAIANGMPLAAVGGKYSVMNCNEYFVSSTYAGETLSLAAAKTTMTLLQTRYDLEWLWGHGRRFLDFFNAQWPDKLRIDGYPSRGSLVGDPLIKGLFMQEACLAGFLFGPSWFFNFPAAEEYQLAFKTLEAIFHRLKRGEVELKGELPKSPFAQRVRESA